MPYYGPGLALDVGGEPVWFASRDAELTPGPEAATCLLAYPCLVEGRPLRYTDAVPGARFLENVRGATDLMGSWWGHAPLRYLLPRPIEAGSELSVMPSCGLTALFFSGGIDSFFSLTQDPGIRLLVFINGFDVRLANRAGGDAMARSFRRIAGDRGLELVTVATNLRDHPVLGKLRWPRYHGAPLATVAHLLRDRASNFLISSSYPRANLMPWGSHPDLDGLWGDDRVTITHFGVEHSRAEKLVAMAGLPLVHRELRVCYPPPPFDGNCGRCEKCVRTRLTYRLALPDILCAGVPDSPPLADALDAIGALWPQTLLEDYRQLLGRVATEDGVTRALRALIDRSERKMQSQENPNERRLSLGRATLARH